MNISQIFDSNDMFKLSLIIIYINDVLRDNLIENKPTMCIIAFFKIHFNVFVKLSRKHSATYFNTVKLYYVYLQQKLFY